MINPIWRGRLRIGDVMIPLRPRDPMVCEIHTAMKTRHRLRELGRRAVHRLRGKN